MTYATIRLVRILSSVHTASKYLGDRDFEFGTTREYVGGGG